MSASSECTVEFSALAELVRDATGLVFPPSRFGDLEAGARKMLAKIGAHEVSTLLRRVRDEESLLDDLVAELTVGETYFFREPRQFEHIRDVIVPELREARGPSHVFRAWSAGCASGEEPYSLAILFDRLGLDHQAHILATDISRPQLARAREGMYGSWSLRGEGAALASPYLRPAAHRLRLEERIRRSVQFGYLNLAQDVYPTLATGTWGMDLVLCRNVLIYLDAPTVRSVAARLHAALAPGGFLIAGPSDPLLADAAPFEVTITQAGVIYRKGGSARPREAVSASLRAPSASTAVTGPIEPRATTPRRLVAKKPQRETSPDPAEAAPPEAVREAFRRGDHQRVIELTRHVTDDPSVLVLQVRALANLGDSRAAAAIASEAVARHPTSTEIGFLQAICLMGLGRYGDAEKALRRVLYIDRSLAVVQFALGAALHRLGRIDAAARAYRNARDLAACRPVDEPLPLGDGEQAGRLMAAAANQLEVLKTTVEAGRWS